MLKYSNYLLVSACLIQSTQIASAAISESDLRDIHYVAHVNIKMDKGIFEHISDIISESEFSAEIKKMRTFSQQDKSVSNMKALRDRVNSDVNTMYKKAYNLGFYDAHIEYKIRPRGHKVKVDIFVDLGAQFNLKLNLTFTNQNEKFALYYNKMMHQQVRQIKAVLSDMEKLLHSIVVQLQKDGFADPLVLEKKAHVDYDQKLVSLNVKIDTRNKVNFGDTHINAFDGISTEFIMNRVDWNKGDVFNVDKVISTAENLKNTQIFSKVKVKPDLDHMIDDTVPMTIDLSEEKKHTVGVSLLYSGTRSMNFEKNSQTQKKLKSVIARLFWERNNAFGGGERVKVTIEGTPMKADSKRSDYAFETMLMLPDVLFKNGNFTCTVSRRQELTNVFFKKSDKGSVTLGHSIDRNIFVNIGASVEQNYLDACDVFFYNSARNKNYKCVSFPIEVVFDKTDDLLNPTEGYKISAKITQSILRGASVRGLSNFDVAYSYNLPIDAMKRTVFAYNIKYSQIMRHSIDDIPIDKRIYAGGMNSVRGYANQMACEVIQGEQSPLGGRKSIEFATELRRKFSSDFGGALFVDGARVFDNNSRYVKLEKKRWFCAVGFGGRYFSGIGPIRFDFAFPIKRRKGIDSKMQFIMSVGQAF